MFYAMTPSLVEIIENTVAIAPHERYYWRYQYLLGEQELVPLLKQWGVFIPGGRVFEFGCGEAGVLGAFANAGAAEAIGADISAYRIEVGRKIASLGNLPIELVTMDLLGEPIPPTWQQRFDVVLMRDVIEHLDNTAKALAIARQLLVPGGSALVTFPPYYSPFGGHQHLLQTILGKVPWVHLVPKPVFEWMIRQSTRAADREEVRRLRNIRLTIHRFESAARHVGLVIARKILYLLRPVFRYKFGLPAVRLPRFLYRTPIVDYCALEALYVLYRDPNEGSTA